MQRSEYRSLLGRLPIKSPTREDMALLCPHLTPDQAVEALTTGDKSAALPPLRVRRGFQIINYREERVEEIAEWKTVAGKEVRVVTGTKNHPARLDWSYAGRTPASYADGRFRGDVFSTYSSMDQAMNFAETHWGSDLVLDDWTSSLAIYIQDPTDLVNDRHLTNEPRTKAVLYIALSRELNSIRNDRSRPESEQFNDAIVQMSLDQIEGYELKGGRGSYTSFNCAHCGAVLSLDVCYGCGHRFRDNHSRCDGMSPLSPKMVVLLREHGLEFKIAPEVAWAQERSMWQQRQLYLGTIGR